MRKSYGLRIAVPVACAAVLMACGGTDGARERQARAPQENSALQAATSGQAATYTLSGCLEAAQGDDAYVLRKVRLEPREPQPQSDLTGSQRPAITEGAWMRLTSESKDLKSYLGQRVSITGPILDDGRSTIGTEGTTGGETPAGDKSQASTSEHQSRKQAKEAGRIARNTIANGTAPEIRVESINPTGSTCEPSTKPEAR